MRFNERYIYLVLFGVRNYQYNLLKYLILYDQVEMNYIVII